MNFFRNIFNRGTSLVSGFAQKIPTFFSPSAPRIKPVFRSQTIQSKDSLSTPQGVVNIAGVKRSAQTQSPQSFFGRIKSFFKPAVDFTVRVRDDITSGFRSQIVKHEKAKTKRTFFDEIQKTTRTAISTLGSVLRGRIHTFASADGSIQGSPVPFDKSPATTSGGSFLENFFGGFRQPEGSYNIANQTEPIPVIVEKETRIIESSAGAGSGFGIAGAAAVLGIIALLFLRRK